jgi:hypothetical protein
MAPASQPVESLGTALERVRCRRPVLIERMMGSLSAHGQLAPLVAVERKGTLEILDGFKRLAAAKRMGSGTLCGLLRGQAPAEAVILGQRLAKLTVETDGSVRQDLTPDLLKDPA